jgi:hypothetical protein
MELMKDERCGTRYVQFILLFHEEIYYLLCLMLHCHHNILKMTMLYQALDYLAFNLLLARDGKYTGGHRGSAAGSDTGGSSLVQAFADELSSGHFIKRFFPVLTTSSSSNNSDMKNPMHQCSEEEQEEASTSDDASLGGGKHSIRTADLMSTPDHPDDALTVARMVHRRKQAAFQEELLTNPFFKPK